MKILFGSIIVDARGRLNGHVAKKTAFGNSISALALPRSRNAWQTNKATQRNAWLFGQWNSLSAERKEVAIEFASQNPLPNEFGVLRNIGGRNMFVRMSSLSRFPAFEISDPFGWETIFNNCQWSALGVNGVTGVLSLEVDNVPESIRFAIYAQQCPINRQVPPSNRWRRFENMEAEGVGIINSVGSLFDLIGQPRAGHRIWLKVTSMNGAGWAGDTSVVTVAVD